MEKEHPAVAVFKGRGSMLSGDTGQHAQPKGAAAAVYAYASQYLANPRFTPLLAKKTAGTGAARPAAKVATPKKRAKAAASPRLGSVTGEQGSGAASEPACSDGAARVSPVTTAAAANDGAGPSTAVAREGAGAAEAGAELVAPKDPVLEGFEVYRAHKHVIRLTQQQRQDNTDGGRRLAKAVQMFNGLQDARREDVVAFLEALSERVVPDIRDLVELEPRVVLQRNDPRHRLNTRLIQSLALHRQQRPIVWNAAHRVVRKRAKKGQPRPPIPAPLTRLQEEAALRAPDKLFGGLTGDTWYIPGALYVHIGNNGADAGACNKNLVRAVGVLLDPREPPDDEQGPYRRLQYQPLAVFVKPVNGQLPDDIAGSPYSDLFPGAFPVLPCTESTEKAIPLSDPAAPDGVRYAKVARTNIALGDAYAVTDYFVQGASFKSECWVVDLAVPPKEIKRACLYVILSRYRSWDDIKLLRPLWTNEFEKQQVIAAFMRAARKDEELWAEDQLQRRGEVAARRHYRRHFERARRLVQERESAAALSAAAMGARPTTTVPNTDGAAATAVLAAAAAVRP